MCDHTDMAHSITGNLFDLINKTPSMPEKVVVLHVAFSILRDKYNQLTGISFNDIKAIVLQMQDDYLTPSTDQTREERALILGKMLEAAVARVETLPRVLQEKVLLDAMLHVALGLSGFFQTDIKCILDKIEHSQKGRVH